MLLSFVPRDIDLFLSRYKEQTTSIEMHFNEVRKVWTLYVNTYNPNLYARLVDDTNITQLKLLTYSDYSQTVAVTQSQERKGKFWSRISPFSKK
jgi:hypothetical protein